ncbi:type II CRISPR RNA-guided endonuclease Cas9 [Geminicoccaceae bacterium 1502E]|nr:type II CRISPR RNA-guided endonuclease Cas9 [Geminicoccaceae bacterium 1502E]
MAMAYRLALDLGANSIGWACLELDGDERPADLLDVGVRVFPDGRHPKTNASLAADRRLARSMRRRRDRYLRRRTALLKALTRFGLMPEGPEERAVVARLDPYALRAAALERRLEPYELGRVIFHLNQRRGFASNRKTDRGNEERGKIDTGAKQLDMKLQAAGARTLGEWLATRHANGEPVRVRLQGSGARATYDFYPTRPMIAAELDAVWEAQAARNPALTDAMRDELRRILLHQRPLRAPLVGKCWLEPSEPRAPKALPLTQRFRIAQDLAHLRIRAPGEPERPLDDAGREKLRALLLTGSDLTFAKMRKELKLSREEGFNLEGAGRDKLAGAETTARLAGKGKPLEAIWPAMDGARREQVVAVLLDTETDDVALAKLGELGVPEEAAQAALRVTLPDGHASLSAKAMAALLPHLERGLRYSDAVREAGYAHHSDDRDGVILPELPYYGEVLRDRLGTGTNEERDPYEKRVGRAPNPTVHVALNELRRVVNALIARHGAPSQIVVEVLRELGRSAVQRSEVEKRQKENREANDRRRALLAELGIPPKPGNLMRVRLWEEQAADPKERRCPYTGMLITCRNLFSDEVEEDHILPFALSLDDSAANRVLASREGNGIKGRRTPHEAFHARPEWPEIVERAGRLPKAKQWRFAPDAMERWKGEHEDFLARHLTDSAYLARLATLYLRAVCDPSRVWSVPGRITALLRRPLGLNDILGGPGGVKNRDDHRHHAVDAITVGLVDQGLLQRVTRAAQQAEEKGHRLMADLSAPWPGFVAQVREAVAGIVVSHKPDTAASGKLHDDNPYGRVRHFDRDNKERPAKDDEPTVVRRRPLTFFADKKKTPDDARKFIRDGGLREKVAEALTLTDTKERAAALNTLEHTGRHPVRRVRTWERLESATPLGGSRSGVSPKLVKPNGNHRAELWRLPGKDGKPGEVVMRVISMLDAARDDEAKRLGRQVPDRRPHPAAKLLLRLHKDDCVAIGEFENRQILRVVKSSMTKIKNKKKNEQRLKATIVLTPHNEGGNLKKRDADKSDPFNYLSVGVSRLVEGKARKVWVDPSGRVHDSGPQAW